MKPRKLKIMGLNSFTDEQTIDFAKLTERGLFGIFGPTGSGKSTILDAITLALYGGKIARDTRDFVNTETKELHVSYEFEIGPSSHRRVFVVDRYMKRGDKGSYTGGKAKLIEITGGVVNVISEGIDEVRDEVVRIIGLNAEDFTRSVVLPQGKFSEFLRLKNQDRRNMLERIFHLEKFGTRMTDRIRRFRWQNEKQIENIDGQLKAFQNVSEELYRSKKEELQKLLEEEAVLRGEKEKAEKDFERFKAVWELQEELKGYRIKLDMLKAGQDDVEEKRIKLQKANSAVLVKPFIDAENETEKKIRDTGERLSSLERELEGLSKKLSEDEKEYNTAYERKEQELPGLIEREAMLKQAIEIEKDIQKLDDQRKKLVEQYREKEKEINGALEKHKKVMELRKETADKIEAGEKRINEIKVDPAYREKVTRAAEVEKEYRDFLKRIKDKEYRIKKLKDDLIKGSEEYKKVSELRKEIAVTLADLEKRKEETLNSCPGDNNLLLKKKDLLQDMGSRLTDAKNNSIRKDDLQNSLDKLKADRDGLSAEIEELSRKIDSRKKEQDTAAKEIEEIRVSNMAAALSAGMEDGQPCPVCGSVHHPYPAKLMDNGLMEEKNRLKEELTKEVEGLSENMNRLQRDFAGILREIDIKQKEIDELNEKLSGMDLENMEAMRSAGEVEFNSLKSALENWEKQKSEVENRLNESSKHKGRLDTSEAGLAESIKKDEESLKLESGDLDSLNEKFQSISLEYNTFKDELKIEDAEQELQKLNKLTREEDNLRNQVNSLRKSAESCDKEKETIESDINNLNLEKAKIEESGKEARKSIDRQREKMEQLSEGREPSKYMVEVRNLMDSIKMAEASLKRKLDIEKEDRQKLTEQKSGEEKNLGTLKNLLEEQHGRLIKSIDENGFEDACEAANCLMDKKDMESLKEEIKSFDDNLKFLENNIVGAEKRLGGRSIDDAQWQDINAKKINISSALEEKTRIIAGEQREIAGMEKDLEEVKKLDKQMKEAQHVKDLLGDIEKLTSGSKFVEFAAMSQLRYIAIEASKRLMEITNGRYALELDSSGEFVMRDDFNGGVKRSVDTLSGGETFLTSLSLAIALSSHIQLKGSAPLEFFFLDEGFGTLDNELLEVVMSSLERLQNEKFSVGIISHVEELKARVPVKLVVTPSKPGVGGSKVRIEYS